MNRKSRWFTWLRRHREPVRSVIERRIARQRAAWGSLFNQAVSDDVDAALVYCTRYSRKRARVWARRRGYPRRVEAMGAALERRMRGP